MIDSYLRDVFLRVLLQVYSWKLSNREARPLHPHRLPCDYPCSNWKPKQALLRSRTWQERHLFKLVNDPSMSFWLTINRALLNHKLIKMLHIKASLCLQCCAFIFHSGAAGVGLYFVSGARGACGLETQDSASLPWNKSWGLDVTKQRHW